MKRPSAKTIGRTPDSSHLRQSASAEPMTSSATSVMATHLEALMATTRRLENNTEELVRLVERLFGAFPVFEDEPFEHPSGCVGDITRQASLLDLGVTKLEAVVARLSSLA